MQGRAQVVVCYSEYNKDDTTITIIPAKLLVRYAVSEMSIWGMTSFRILFFKQSMETFKSHLYKKKVSKKPNSTECRLVVRSSFTCTKSSVSNSFLTDICAHTRKAIRSFKRIRHWVEKKPANLVKFALLTGDFQQYIFLGDGRYAIGSDALVKSHFFACDAT